MDEIDRKIIELLMQDAGTPLSKIADSIGVPRPTVYLRFNKMLQDGTIKGFNLVLGANNNGKLKSAILKVRNHLVSDNGPGVMRKLGEKLSKRSDVRFASKISPDSVLVIWQGDGFDPKAYEEVAEVQALETEVYKGV